MFELKSARLLARIIGVMEAAEKKGWNPQIGDPNLKIVTEAIIVASGTKDKTAPEKKDSKKVSA